MEMTLPVDRLVAYLHQQLTAIYPDGDGARPDDVRRFVVPALERVETCFSANAAKGFGPAGSARFNHRHSDQYAIFLYYVANTAFRLAPGDPVAEKAYGLNKFLHGVDAYFEVELPDVFLLVHPVGTVLGRASYGEYFCCYQNVTVGSNLSGDKPAIGPGVVLFGGSRVIGKTRIGANCMVSTGAVLIDQHVPDDSLIFGTTPGNVVKPSRRNVKQHLFGITP